MHRMGVFVVALLVLAASACDQRVDVEAERAAGFHALHLEPLLQGRPLLALPFSGGVLPHGVGDEQEPMAPFVGSPVARKTN